MIRNMTIADFPAVMQLGERLHEQSVYSDVPMDSRTIAATIGQCISSALGFAVVAVHDGKITGVMLGAAAPLWFSKSRSATDFVTYSEWPGDGFRMVRRFIKWAWTLPNVTEITLGQSSGIEPERAARLYSLLGMRRVGNLYTVVREQVATEAAA